MSETESVEDLRGQADRIMEMRSQLVSQVNDLFATIADLAEGESGAKYDALFKFSERMQDERDALRAEVESLKRELVMARRASTRAAPEGEEAVAALVQRGAIEHLVGALRSILDIPISAPEAARVMGRVNEALVAYDDRMKGGRADV